jgi:hypothetical protein
MHAHSFMCIAYLFQTMINHTTLSLIFLIPHPKFPHQTIHTQISLTGGGVVGSGLPSFNMQAKAEGSVFQTVSFGMVISLQFGFSFCYLSSMIKCNRCCATLNPDTTCSMMLTICRWDTCILQSLSHAHRSGWQFLWHWKRGNTIPKSCWGLRSPPHTWKISWTSDLSRDVKLATMSTNAATSGI